MPCNTCNSCSTRTTCPSQQLKRRPRKLPCPPASNYKCTGKCSRIYSRWSNVPCKPTYLPICCPKCPARGTLQVGNSDGGFLLTECTGPLFGNRVPVCLQS